MHRSLPNGTIRPHDKRGYLRIKDPTHPLADKKGWVKHHRWVVYNHVNGEPQHCAYCGYGPLPWHGGSQHAINIDHINNTPGDDRIENLTSACGWCNTFKAQWPYAKPEHQQAIKQHQHTHPTQRPGILSILIEAWGIPWTDVVYNLQQNQ